MLQPFVVLTLVFESGRLLSLELTIKRFHLLRKTVAELLKQMQLVHSRYAIV